MAKLTPVHGGGMLAMHEGGSLQASRLAHKGERMGGRMRERLASSGHAAGTVRYHVDT